jgi:hypothetical protein
MNAIGKGLAEIAKVGEDLYKRHKEIRRENDLQAMQIETEKDWLTFKTGYDRSNPDPMNYMKDTEKAWDDIVKKRSGMTKDGETSRAYKDKMNVRKMMILVNSQIEADKRFHDAYFAESISNVDEWANLAVTTENPGDAETFKTDMLAEIHKGYPFTEKYAGELENSKLDWIKKERAKNAEGRVYQDILRDPGGTLQKLMLPPEAGQYPDITEPTKREALRGHTQTIFHMKQVEQRQEEARIKAENHDTEELQIGSLYSIGKLKINDIQAAKFLSGDERFTWTARIEARQKAGPVIKTNFSTYARIQDMIFSGQPKKEISAQIAAASEKDLTEGAAENLLNKLTAYQGHVEDHWTRKSYDYLKSQITKATDVNMIGEIINAQAAEDYFKATTLLDSAIAGAKQKGKTLSGEQIFEEAKKILPLVKRSGKEMIQSIKEEREKQKAVTTPSGKKYQIEEIR